MLPLKITLSPFYNLTFTFRASINVFKTHNNNIGMGI